MARKPAAAKGRARADQDGDDDRKAGKGHNTKRFEGEVLSKYLETVHAAEDRIAKRMAEASKKCQADRKLVASATKELVESGYSSKPLATLRRKVKLEYKAATIDSTLDDEAKEEFQSMADALGPFADTELGRAALARDEE